MRARGELGAEEVVYQAVDQRGETYELPIAAGDRVRLFQKQQRRHRGGGRALGPVELWALSTTPSDSALRNRLYARLGFSEALRRLSRVFPYGSAEKEIAQRKDDRLKRGENEEGASVGVLDELALELANGSGLGIILRDPDPRHEAVNDTAPPPAASIHAAESHFPKLRC